MKENQEERNSNELAVKSPRNQVLTHKKIQPLKSKKKTLEPEETDEEKH